MDRRCSFLSSFRRPFHLNLVIINQKEDGWTSRSPARPGGSLGGPVPPAAAHYRPRLVGDEAGNSHPRSQFHEEQGSASFAAPERIPRVGVRPCQANGDAGRAPTDDVGGLHR